MKLPETKTGCEALLAMTEADLKPLLAQRRALQLKLVNLQQPSARKPARTASAGEEKVTEGET